MAYVPLKELRDIAIARDGVYYTIEEIKLAFEVVANPSDWRGPIDAVIPNSPKLRSAVSAAVEFYTATCPEFKPEGASGFVRVTAIGYRNGPAGP